MNANYYYVMLRRFKLRCIDKYGSQRAFASALFIDPANLSRILNGISIPSATFFLDMCRLLDFDLELK